VVRRDEAAGKGFLFCFLLNLIIGYWWGILALILFLIYLWFDIPYYVPLIGIGVWIGSALISTMFVSWVVRSSNEPPPQQKNMNPYSAKTKDILNIPKGPVKAPQPAAAVSTGNDPEQSKSDLKKAMLLLGVSGILFDELFDRANDFPKLLDGLCGLAYMNYHPDSKFIDVEGSLSRSAVRSGKAYIINSGAGGCYVGMAPFINADEFVKKMSDWFFRFNPGYSIKLL